MAIRALQKLADGGPLTDVEDLYNGEEGVHGGLCKEARAAVPVCDAVWPQFAYLLLDPGPASEAVSAAVPNGSRLLCAVTTEAVAAGYDGCLLFPRASWSAAASALHAVACAEELAQGCGFRFYVFFHGDTVIVPEDQVAFAPTVRPPDCPIERPPTDDL